MARPGRGVLSWAMATYPTKQRVGWESAREYIHRSPRTVTHQTMRNTKLSLSLFLLIHRRRRGPRLGPYTLNLQRGFWNWNPVFKSLQTEKPARFVDFHAEEEMAYQHPVLFRLGLAEYDGRMRTSMSWGLQSSCLHSYLCSIAI